MLQWIRIPLALPSTSRVGDDVSACAILPGITADLADRHPLQAAEERSASELPQQLRCRIDAGCRAPLRHADARRAVARSLSPDPLRIRHVVAEAAHADIAKPRLQAMDRNSESLRYFRDFVIQFGRWLDRFRVEPGSASLIRPAPKHLSRRRRANDSYKEILWKWAGPSTGFGSVLSLLSISHSVASSAYRVEIIMLPVEDFGTVDLRSFELVAQTVPETLLGT